MKLFDHHTTSIIASCHCRAFWHNGGTQIRAPDGILSCNKFFRFLSAKAQAITQVYNLLIY